MKIWYKELKDEEMLEKLLVAYRNYSVRLDVLNKILFEEVKISNTEIFNKLYNEFIDYSIKYQVIQERFKEKIIKNNNPFLFETYNYTWRVSFENKVILIITDDNNADFSKGEYNELHETEK